MKCRVLLLVLLFVAHAAHGQETPTLTDVQKLKIQNLAQAMEIAQLRAQQAQRDFDAARGELGKLVTSLQVDGYTLDLQALVYVKKAEDKPPK